MDDEGPLAATVGGLVWPVDVHVADAWRVRSPALLMALLRRGYAGRRCPTDG